MTVITLHNSGGCVISIIHDPDDPSAWVVRQWKRGVLFRKRVLSRWFCTRAQAEAFAKKLAESCSHRK